MDLTRENLASPEYQSTLAEMHRRDTCWGDARPLWADIVARHAQRIEPRSVLDYGCGKGWLSAALRKRGHDDVKEYDPGIPGKQALPERADFVVCNDVLEHVEPDRVWAVLEHLHHVTRCVLFVNIVLKPARRQALPDGRNPHLSVHGREWWMKQIAPHFSVVDIPARGRPEHELTALLYPKMAPPILIAAPPRSGTSFIAGLLWRYGAWIGESVPADEGNPLGYYENRHLVELNKRMLKANGQRGKCEPPILDRVQVPFNIQARVRASVDARGETPWLFKDGKLLRVWRVWAEAFPTARWVLPMRPLRQVIASMGRHPTWKRRGDAEYHQKCAAAMAEAQLDIAESVQHPFLVAAEDLIIKQNEDIADELARFCGLKHEPGRLAEWAQAERYHV